MRLKQIKIVNFGQFSNKKFDLPGDQIMKMWISKTRLSPPP